MRGFMSKILAIDYGTRKIGLALSDELKKIAWPYAIIEYKTLTVLIQQISEVIKKEKVEKIIIGFPIQSSGYEGLSLDQVQRFKKLLEEKIDIKIEFENELFSSSLAKKLKGLARDTKDKPIDDAAAAVILQSYLDRTGKA